jgi:hypothetical protein
VPLNSLDNPSKGDMMILALDILKESQMPRLPHRIDLLLLEIGLTIILAIELYKFIKFIAS